MGITTLNNRRHSQFIRRGQRSTGTGGDGGTDPIAAYATLNGTNERFTLGDVLDSVFAGANATFRIVAVVRPGAVMTNNMIVGKLLTTGNNRQFFARLTTGSVPELLWYGLGDGGSYRSSIGTTAVTDTGKWYTIEFSYDGTAAVDDRVGIIVDGTDETTPDLSLGSPTQIQDLAADLEFGSFNGGGGYWDGDIASIKIYDAASGGSLVAQYDFDTTLGTTLVDKVGSNDGTLVGSPSTVWSGYTPPATYATLNGVGEFFTVVDDASLDFGTAQDFSISVWFKTTATAAASYLVAKGDTNAAYWLRIQGAGGNVRFLMDYGATFDDAAGTNSFNDGEWHLAVGTADRDGNITLYVDGNQEAQVAATAGDVDNARPMRIGIADDGVAWPFAGDITGVQVFDRALTAGEALNLAQNKPVTAGVTRYDFDTTLGSTLLDKVGSNHGTLVGDPATVWSEYTEPAAYATLNGVDEYFPVPSFELGGQFAVEAVVRFATIKSSSICCKAITSTSGMEFNFNLEADGRVRFWITQNSTAVVGICYSAGTVSTGRWYTIAGVFDGSQTYVVLDGAQGTSGSAVGAKYSGASDFQIGRYPAAGWNIDADIAQLKVYTDPVDKDNLGTLLAQYDFDATGGTTLVDKVGSNDGTLVGNPVTVWSNYTP